MGTLMTSISTLIHNQLLVSTYRSGSLVLTVNEIQLVVMR